MAERLSEKWSKIIHRMGQEREDRITGDTIYGLLSRRLRKWAEKVIDIWRRHEEMLLGRQLKLFQNLLESKKEADKQRNCMRLQILCRRCGCEMELFSIAYLKGNELRVIGGWRWIEQRLMYREMV